jgi:hypothetical protein
MKKGQNRVVTTILSFEKFNGYIRNNINTQVTKAAGMESCPKTGTYPNMKPCHHKTVGVFPAKTSQVLIVYGQQKAPIIPEIERINKMKNNPPPNKLKPLVDIPPPPFFK